VWSIAVEVVDIRDAELLDMAVYDKAMLGVACNIWNAGIVHGEPIRDCTYTRNLSLIVIVGPYLTERIAYCRARFRPSGLRGHGDHQWRASRHARKQLIVAGSLWACL
jgi:hypothetical protein